MAEPHTENDSVWATRSLRRWRTITALSAAAMLLILAWAPTKELLRPWRRFQSQYNRLAASYGVASADIEVRQIWIPEAGRADRCGSCHLGMVGLPALESNPPFQSHPAVPHPAESYGCTYCHAGQGWATVAKEAHGEEGTWAHPIFTRARTEAGCGFCHSGMSVPLPEEVEEAPETVAEFGCETCHAASSDEVPTLRGIALRGVPADWPERHRGLILPDAQTRPVAQAEEEELAVLDAWLRTHVGAPHLARGKMVFQQLGCQGCHRRGDVGGDVGPELTHVGERDVREVDGESAGPGTLARWLRRHLVEPQALFAESRMPPVDLDELERESDLADLVTFLLSLRGEGLPRSLTPPDRARTEHRFGRDFPTSGRGLYVTFCSACHGFYATGAELETYGLVTPMVGSRGFLATVTPRYLRASIERGRRGRYMPSWGVDDGGLEGSEIDAIVGYLTSQAAKIRPLEGTAGAGDHASGGALFARRCLPCHAQGETAPRFGADLLAQGALRHFDRRTLYQAIVRGWVEEGMPSFAFLPAREVRDLLAFLDASGRPGPRPGPGHDGRHSHFGLQIWRVKCLECHGPEGEGDSAPMLNTTPYLEWAGDDYLATRIRAHRDERARTVIGSMSDDDTEALLDHMRSWSGRVAPPPPVAPDEAAIRRGRGLYGGRCNECHGETGGGGTGPALANRDFLDLVARPFLVMTILEGRKGTPMQAWKDNREQPVGLEDAFDLADYILSFRTSGGATHHNAPGQQPGG